MPTCVTSHIASISARFHPGPVNATAKINDTERQPRMSLIVIIIVKGHNVELKKVCKLFIESPRRKNERKRDNDGF